MDDEHPSRRIRIRVDPLPVGANPTQCGSLVLGELDDDDRDVNCAHQSKCITLAAAENWRGFHCRNCTVNAPMTRDAQRQDLDGLAILASLICDRSARPDTYVPLGLRIRFYASGKRATG